MQENIKMLENKIEELESEINKVNKRSTKVIEELCIDNFIDFMGQNLFNMAYVASTKNYLNSLKELLEIEKSNPCCDGKCIECKCKDNK